MKIYWLALSIVLLYLYATVLPPAQQTYKCLPCGYECDQMTYNEPGTCSHCQMKLVPEKTIYFGKLQTDQLCDYVRKNPSVVLLDVRTPLEFSGKAEPNFGSLKNAINIPVQELEARIKELDRYKGREIIVFCSHSHRSPQAAWILNQNGFRKVKNMEGGMSVMPAASCVTRR